ncbi:MAG: Uma2 family endonuclease [Gemmataceae bacterium]
MPESIAVPPLETIPVVAPPAAPDMSNVVIDDGKPVDNIYSERQMRLLVDPLYASWQGPGGGRRFVALVNVGIFSAVDQPPIVPNVLLSLDMVLKAASGREEHLTYVMWVVGKAPEAVFEVVSNGEGNELGSKLAKYQQLRIPYYVVWDPEGFLGAKRLHVFTLTGGLYRESEPWFPLLELGVTLWQGEYEGMDKTWLRWCDARGDLLATGPERAQQEQQRADQQQQRADQQQQRADQQQQRADQQQQRADQQQQRADQQQQRAEALAAKLREMGVDPNGLG